MERMLSYIFLVLIWVNVGLVSMYPVGRCCSSVWMLLWWDRDRIEDQSNTESKSAFWASSSGLGHFPTTGTAVLVRRPRCSDVPNPPSTPNHLLNPSQWRNVTPLKERPLTPWWEFAVHLPMLICNWNHLSPLTPPRCTPLQRQGTMQWSINHPRWRSNAVCWSWIAVAGLETRVGHMTYVFLCRLFILTLPVFAALWLFVKLFRIKWRLRQLGRNWLKNTKMWRHCWCRNYTHRSK